MRALIAILCMSIMLLIVALSPQTDAIEEGPREIWLKLVFGADGEPAQWDGRLAVQEGKLLELSAAILDVGDELRPQEAAWKIKTEIPQARRVSFAESQRELFVSVLASEETRISVSTQQGNFQIAPLEIAAGRPASLLDGRVEAHRLGTQAVVAQTKTDDDFAAIAVAENGDRHVAWVSYDADAQEDRLYIQNVDNPLPTPELITEAQEVSDLHLLKIDGRLTAFWTSSGTDKNWDLYTATRDVRGWRTKRLTTADRSDVHLSVAVNKAGTVWLAWQSFRNHNGDIYAKVRREGTWSDDIVVEENAANQWQPSVTVDSNGKAWIGFDSYENGNYDVYLTSFDWRNGKPIRGERIAVAQSPDFEAHANVLADSEDRIWIAYDAAGPNWGKDFRNGPTIENGQYAEPLHASRRLELRCWDNGQLKRPTGLLPQVLPPEKIAMIDRDPRSKPSRFYEFPQLAEDGEGRLWLFFRLCRQGFCRHPPLGAQWNIYATTFTEQGWLEPIQLPHSQGRQNQRVATVPGAGGRLQCAWAEGNRFASVNRKYVVRRGALPPVSEPAAAIPCEPYEVTSPETADPAPVIDWTITRGADEYRVYFGDLHRHTNISRCMPTLDGCLTDAHRYALDAVQHDFLAVTDHTRDVDAFSWWRTQKAADWYHVPGVYVPIYGYERSNMTHGGGHRNVFFLTRGAEVSKSDHWYAGRNLKRPDSNPDTTLYPWLRERGDSFTAAHTPEYDRKAGLGTWTYNDPQVEPVAEIFQALRESYERPNSRVKEEMSLWFALRKGHRLGFIASSDHISTHMSYACVWAADKSREAIFEAIRSRRTYAATDRIGLDVRIGEALMGEETRVGGETVTISIKAVGTAPITDIEIIRSGEVLETLRPGTEEIELKYTDKTPLPGKSYYYVRLLQDNGAIAWASPIWVSR